MTNNSSSMEREFYDACCNNDLKTAQEKFKPSELIKIYDNGNTILHIASSRGYTDIVRFLLRYRAPRTIRNDHNLTAEQLAGNEEIKKLFNTNRFIAKDVDLDWVDTYENAHRISHENLNNMKQWITKIPLKKLLDEIYNGYIDKSEKLNENQKRIIKDVMKEKIPEGLVKAYTHTGISFYDILNKDLAAIGSDFRFLCISNMFAAGYSDYDAPKGFGQHIFAAIVINHQNFRQYYRTGTTCRGMNITQKDLNEYVEGNIFMTRSFLSTSQDEDLVKFFLNLENNHDYDEQIPVICTYTVKTYGSSMSIDGISYVPTEAEVLIFPFVVFKVIYNRGEDIIDGNNKYHIKRIKLEEYVPNI